MASSQVPTYESAALDPMDERIALAPGLSASTFAVVCAALLVFVSGSFLVAEALGIKRVLQVVLAFPLVLVAAYSVATRPRRLINPLIGFVLLKTVIEAAVRHGWLDLFDDLATLLALGVLYTAPRRSIKTGASVLVGFAGVMAFLALIQWFVLFLNPSLIDFCLTVSDNGEVDGTIRHPVALLGLVTGEEFTLFGHPISRLQSFAKEPSLNIVYFLIPAVLAYLRGTFGAVMLATIMLAFCVLSLSGSVFMCLAFTGMWWLMRHLVSVKTMMQYGTLTIFGLYVALIRTSSLDAVLAWITVIGQFGDFLDKTNSFSSRAGGAVTSVENAISAPLGSTVLPNLPGPFLINASLAAGWLGALLLVVFLRQLARRLNTFHPTGRRRAIYARRAALLLVGVMTTVVAFNDYQMSNYAGIVLLAFVYRTLEPDDERVPTRKVMRRSGLRALLPVAAH